MINRELLKKISSGTRDFNKNSLSIFIRGDKVSEVFAELCQLPYTFIVTYFKNFPSPKMEDVNNVKK